jgi:hypothetical protein
MTDDQSAPDQVRHAYAPGASDVRLVTASFRTHHFVPHAHSEYAVAVIGRGVEAVRCRGADERAGTGDLLPLDAEVLHAGRPAAPRAGTTGCSTCRPPRPGSSRGPAPGPAGPRLTGGRLTGV